MMGPTLGEPAVRFAQVSDIHAARTGVLRDDWRALKLIDVAPARDEAANLFATVAPDRRHSGMDIEAALERKWFRHPDSAI
jgi:hypothetical protein